jgi:hypothetical protein
LYRSWRRALATALYLASHFGEVRSEPPHT